MCLELASFHLAGQGDTYIEPLQQKKVRRMRVKHSKIEMTSGPLPKNILRFMIPVMLMAILQILFIACDDMLILGYFVGSKALAAVGATNYFVNLLVNAFLGLSVGVNVVVAQCIGAGEDGEIRKAIHTAIAAGCVFGLILLCLGTACARFCLEAMNTPSDIIGQSISYLRIYFFSAPATLLFNFASAILRAQGDSRHPFVYLTISGICDIVFCTLLVVVCGLGVEGSALGTAAAQYIAAVLAIRHLMRGKEPYKLSARNLKIHKDIFVRICFAGIPSGLNNMAFSFSNMQIQSAVNLFGSSAVAGCSASVTLEGFAYAATNSVMQAAVSFSGQNAGAKNYKNVSRTLKWCLLYTSIIGTAAGGLILLAGESVLSVFIDEQAIHYAMLRNGSVMLPYMFCGMMEVFSGTLRGLGKSIMPTAVTLIGVCGLRILWTYTVFQSTMSLGVLFLSFPLSWFITTVVNGIYYLYVMKQYKKGLWE